MAGSAAPREGVIFVATGAEKYPALAARAAASIRSHAPGLAIDLFTDRSDIAAGDPAGFDRVHLLDDPWFRSKIDGLLSSRFERTLYMDADTLALADFRDVFAVLERFDIALAHDWFRNSDLHHSFWQKELPGAFPQFNGGLIALRRNPATTRFLEDWKAAVKTQANGRDQISLRELLWDSELRIATLPEEYNLLFLPGLRLWTPDFAAPRILHSPRLHRDYDRLARAADPVAELAGIRTASKLPLLLAADKGLARLAGRPAAPPDRRARLGRLVRILAALPARLAARARRRLGRG